MTKNFKKLFASFIKKNCKFYKKKIAETCDIKSWKLNHDQIKFSSNLLSNPNGGFLTLEAQKIWKTTINFKKIGKKIGKKREMQKVKGVKVTRKVKIVKRKFCIKKDTNVYNNCYELSSRAIYKVRQRPLLLDES